MPADSERPRAGPVLPHTWRPFGVRLVGMVAGLGLLAVCVAAWIALGEDIRSRFTPFEKLTLVMLGLLGAAVWYALLRSRLSASDDDVAVVNGFRARHYDWAQIVALRLRRGAPWAEMDLSDGTTVPVMAIQGSDGDRAKTAVREFRRVLAARTRTRPQRLTPADRSEMVGRNAPSSHTDDASASYEQPGMTSRGWDQPVALSRRWRRSWAASSTSLWRHSAAR